MKAKKKRRVTKREREAAHEAQLTEARERYYKAGVDAGRAQQVATYEDRRFVMAEALIGAATFCARVLGYPNQSPAHVQHVAQIVDALAHMMPYRNGNNQRP